MLLYASLLSAQIRETRRRALSSVTPTVIIISSTSQGGPETNDDDDSSNRQQGTTSLFDEEALATRVNQNTSALVQSKEEWKTKAIAQLTSLGNLAESLSSKFEDLQACRQGAMTQKEALWGQRETYRLKQLSALAEEARLAEEAAKAAAAAAGVSATGAVATKKAGKK